MEIVGYSHDVAMVRELFMTTAMDMLVGLVGEQVKTQTYQRNYAEGFVERISVRIMLEIVEARKTRVKEGVSHGAALAIRDQRALILDRFNELYPRLGTYRAHKSGYDPKARARGAARANAMDLGGAGRIAGNGTKPSVGGPRKGIDQGNKGRG